MYRRILLIISFSLTLLIGIEITGCKETPKKVELLNSFAGYCENSPSTIISGKLYFNDLLKDLSYQQIPKLNDILSKELRRIKKGIDLKSPLYFCVDSLLNNEGIPTDFKVFIQLNNKDSILDELRGLGMFVAQYRNMHFVLQPPLAIGIHERTMVVHFSSISSKKSLFHTFQLLKKEGYDSKIHQLLSDKSSVSFNLHLKNIVDLLHPEEKVRPKSAFTSSYVHSTLNFQEGAISGNSYFEFSETLKKRMFFHINSSKEIPFQHPSSQMVAGLRLHLSSTKIETLLEDYFPQVLTQLTQNSTEAQLALLAMGEHPLRSALSGDMEFRLVQKGQEILPEYNIGLGEKKQLIAQLLNSPMMTDLPFHVNGNQLVSKNSSKRGIPSLFPYLQPQKKYGLFGFIDFNKYSTFYENDPRYAGLKALSHFVIYGDNEKISWKLQAKNKQKGIIYQIVMSYYQELAQQIAGQQIVL